MSFISNHESHGEAMTFNEKVELGRTGLKVSRLGIASGYWAPAGAIEEAFERGCNYVTWGTFVKGFSPHCGEALRNIAAKGQRDRLVLAMFSYAHHSFVTEHFLRKGLKAAGLDYADVLILGFFPKRPSRRIIEGAMKLKEKGLVRFIGLSGHHRSLFTKLRNDAAFDVFHLRYNAVHRGAETEDFSVPAGGKETGNRKLYRHCMGQAPQSAEDAGRRNGAYSG